MHPRQKFGVHALGSDKKMRKNLVRLSDFEHAQLEGAREELMKKGIANIPEMRSLCPKCGGQVDGFRISYEYVRCSHCGYEDQSAAITAVGTFALGTIAALGAAALVHLLTSGEED